MNSSHRNKTTRPKSSTSLPPWPHRFAKALDRAADSDRRFFEQNPGLNRRERPIIPGEFYPAIDILHETVHVRRLLDIPIRIRQSGPHTVIDVDEAAVLATLTWLLPPTDIVAVRGNRRHLWYASELSLGDL